MMNAFDKAWYFLKSEPRFEHIGRYNGRDVGILHYPSSVKGKIRSMPFYRSSGVNSGEPGSWKFFHGVTTHPKPTEFHSGDTGDRFTTTPREGWMIKPQVADHAFEYDHTQGPRYGHARIKNLSEWMDENVKDAVYDVKEMDGAQINQHLRNNNAWGMHDMAQGIQPQQPQQYPANDLRSQASWNRSGQ